MLNITKLKRNIEMAIKKEFNMKCINVAITEWENEHEDDTCYKVKTEFVNNGKHDWVLTHFYDDEFFKEDKVIFEIKSMMVGEMRG